jgi:dTDP-glucose 4,6-dehydratase
MIITHTMNVFGERQHKEKFIPIVINRLREGKMLQIHCANGRPASRAWIHARNAASAIMFLLENTPDNVRDKWNITGEVEFDNYSLALEISKIMDMRLSYEKVDHYSGRPGHDPRYMLDGEKLRLMGWEMPKAFDQALEKTILWSLENKRWLEWK